MDVYLEREGGHITSIPVFILILHHSFDFPESVFHGFGSLSLNLVIKFKSFTKHSSLSFVLV